jgi:dihydrofolate synthase/folylpolyglutamate synthase
LPKNAIYYFCKPDIPRGLDAGTLKSQALGFNLIGDSYATVMDALNAAKEAATSQDLIFIGGSTFVVAEVV